MRASHVTLAAAFGFLVVCGVLPLIAMLIASVTIDGRINWSAYGGLITSDRNATLLWNSLFLGVFTAAGAFAFGVPLGIMFGRTDLHLRYLFAVVFTIPLAIPPYVSAVAWSDILGRDVVSGLAGCVLVLVPALTPVVLLSTMSIVRGVDPVLEEAARLTCSWSEVLRRITLPLIMRGIVFAVALVFLLAIGEFGVPSFLRYDVFPVESFTQFAAFLDFRAATASAVPLIVFAVLILSFEFVLVRDVPALVRVTGRKPLVIPLGRFKHLVGAVIVLLSIVLVFLPLWTLARQAAWGSALSRALPLASGSIVRSMTYAAVGATVLAAMGLLLGYLVDRRALSFWRAVDWTAITLFAMPSTVLGIGLIALWNQPLPLSVYGTPAMIILGYVAQYTALTSRLTASVLSQIPVSLEDSARVAGASWSRRMLLIIVPLCGRGLMVSWLAAYVFCLRDLGISALVYPPGGDTLPVRTFTLMANGPPEIVASLCLVTVVMTVVPLAIAATVLVTKPEGGLRDSTI